MAQYAAYSALPSVVAGGAGGWVGVVLDRALTMACNWAVVMVESDCMAPTPLMPACTWASVAPSLLEVARAPWQPAQ